VEARETPGHSTALAWIAPNAFDLTHATGSPCTVVPVWRRRSFPPLSTVSPRRRLDVLSASGLPVWPPHRNHPPIEAGYIRLRSFEMSSSGKPELDGRASSPPLASDRCSLAHARRANQSRSLASTCPAPFAKIFLFFRNPNQPYISHVPPHRGAYHDRRETRGGMRWTRMRLQTSGA
jgi:hypothetical protein